MAAILPASHADKIQWLNDIPVWVDQWSLPKEKIEAASYSPKRNILPYYEAVAQMIILGRKQALTYFGKEPDIIVQPYSVG
jgi:hypothetical protein